ncbi:MAG: hypothetical protein Nk1A_7170 [Endomicrobiia bacterium]|nr:MAG: hypothetical protein Nk1A_7170 [Endomicrobiia bacterium]
MEDKDAKEYIKAHPEIYFQKARRSGYVCPLCQNGEGKDGTGIEEIKGREGLYKCFKCNFSGDVLAFIAKQNNLDIKSDFQKVMDIACGIYGISKDNNDGRYKVKHDDAKDKKVAKQPEPDYTKYFEEQAKHISEIDYLTNRGVQEKFNVGYCKEWRPPGHPCRFFSFTDSYPS